MDLQSNKINLNNIDLQNNKNKLVIYIYIYIKILSILTHTHKGRGEKFLKKLTVVYIQKGLIVIFL